MGFKQELPLMVQAVNMANKEANALYSVLAGWFKQFVGMPILKADGTLLKRVKDGMPVFPAYSQSLHFYQRISDYSLAWMICGRIWDSDRSAQHEVTVYIGKLKGTMLDAIEDEQKRREDYKLEEIVALLDAAAVAKKAYDEAKGKLYPFESFHRYW